MRHIVEISILSLGLLVGGQAVAAPVTPPPPGRMHCDPRPCPMPGLPVPKPLYAVIAGCVLYVDRDVEGPQFHVGPVFKISETAERAVLESSYYELAPEYQDSFSAVRCDDIPQARCHVSLFFDRQLKGSAVEIVGSQGLVDLASAGIDNQVSSLTITCDVLKNPA